MRQALPPRRPCTKSTTSDNAQSRRNRTNTKASGSSSVNAILKMDGDRPQINTTKSSPRSVERDVLERKKDLPAPRFHRRGKGERKGVNSIILPGPPAEKKER